VSAVWLGIRIGVIHQLQADILFTVTIIIGQIFDACIRFLGPPQASPLPSPTPYFKLDNM
jgi:hypothetical protein